MKNFTMFGDVKYYTGVIGERLAEICLEPQDAGEIELLLDLSSNWMKLFDARNSLSILDLRKILYVEACGRRRDMMIDRVRALIETRRRDRNIAELEEMLKAVKEEEKCESE